MLLLTAACQQGWEVQSGRRCSRTAGRLLVLVATAPEGRGADGVDAMA
jgi:hypothetical protein